MADKVLIIEDEATLGEVLLKKMQEKGYEVQLVTDGEKGLQTLREWRPNLVLLDIVLPSKNGYEILEEKAKDPAITHIPVIIISNSGQPVEISRTVNLGVKDYMIKTDFDPNEIISKVEEQLTPTNTPATALKDKTILVVEDDSFLSYIVTTKLQHHGANVLGASSAEEAFAELQKQTPHLILLDLVLGAVSGFEILEQLKKDEKTAHIPVIVLSNLNQQEDVARCKKLGAHSFLLKADVTPDVIVQEINKLFEQGAQT